MRQLAADRIKEHAADYNKAQSLFARYPDPGASTDGAAAAAVPADRPELVTADLALVTKLLDESKQTLTALAPKRQEARMAKVEADELRVELAKLTARRNSLELESLPDGRVEVVERAEAPVDPSSDARKKFAAAGAVGGAALPAGLIVLLGLVNRRYRFSDEAETGIASSAPLLGILPALPRRLLDPEQAANAAQCIHHIRVLLQVGGGRGARRRRQSVYLLTSTTPGEGKTSLAVSLALSFAASGSRTLLIDCDLIAQRVSRGFNLGGQPGLRDALAAGTIRGYAKRTASGLWVCPIGHADVLDACAVSSNDVTRLLGDARRYFDTIIVDSGPVLGSVEATTVAPQADGVIFTVSRGQQPHLVDKALKHLESVGAVVAGFVFNRAGASDFSRSAHASSLRSIPSSSIPTRQLVTDSDACGRFGPLVQSVVSLLPVSRELVTPTEIQHPAQGQMQPPAATGATV
jgi:Mrp family chromosome partitioning ATPase